MDELFQAIRESCSAAAWSKGVTLNRSDAVVGLREKDGEVELRVTPPGQVMGTAVYLYPAAEDWSCECSSTEDVCWHVAGAVIALRQARKAGLDLPGAQTARAELGYRLQRVNDRLALTRVLCTDGTDTPLEGTLSSGAHPNVVSGQIDLQIETLLSGFGDGPLPSAVLTKLFGLLADANDVTLAGEPVEFGDPMVGLRAVVEDCADGFRVRLEADPKVRSIFDNGAVGYGNTLHVLREHGLNEREWAALRNGKIIVHKDVGNLVGELLPRLENRFDVAVKTDKLPGRKKIRPRLSIETTRDGVSMRALGHVVYGDPAIARLDGDSLTMLRKGPVPQRELRREQKLLRTLKFEHGLEPGVVAMLETKDAISFVARVDDAVLAGAGHRDFFAADALDPFLEDGLGFETAQGQRADPGAVLAAFERGESLAPLLEGGFAPLPHAWLSQHIDRVRGILSARESTPGWALADLGALYDSLGEEPPPNVALVRELLERANDAEPELPSDLSAELRDYQHRGVAWLGLLRRAQLGALLADDMGLGKTLQTLCALRGKSLVVAPTSVLHNWSKEAETFRSGLRLHVYHGPGRALDSEADLTLTTYAILRLDAAALAAVNWGTVVLDEAQAIKNPSSQTAQAAYGLNAEFRVALTGTPVENKLEDLWSQLNFLNPGLLGKRTDFQERYAKPVRDGDTGAAALLRARIRPFILRRLKSEVATELPPRTDSVLHCELNEGERATYNAVQASTREDVIARLGEGVSAIKILEALLRLRQAACHAGLVPGAADDVETSSKVELLVEQLELNVDGGHKALVFSQWTGLLDRVEPRLRNAGIDFTRLDGSTRDRGAVVDSFQSQNGPPVMLISLKAGGTGLNLTAADHVYLLDPWWNPAVEDQAADRAHRIGQDKPVTVYRLVARNTVEERILALQDRKRELANAALDGASVGVGRDELLALLQ